MSTSVSMSMEPRAAIAAFTALRNRQQQRDSYLHDDVHALVFAVLDAQSLQLFAARVVDILFATLFLLKREQQRPQEEQDRGLVLLLLRLARALQSHKERWPAGVAGEYAAVLVRLFLDESESAEPEKLALLASLISAIDEDCTARAYTTTHSTQSVHRAIQSALVEWSQTPAPRQYVTLEVRRLCGWGEKKYFDDVATVLLEGSALEQETMLKCLLIYRREVRDNFIRHQEGAELTLRILETDTSALTKQLMRVFAREAALHSHAFRTQMIDIWAHRHSIVMYTQHLPPGERAALEGVARRDADMAEDKALLEALQHGEAYEKFIHLNTLGWNDTLIGRLCMDCSLLEIVAHQLSGQNTTDVEIKTRFWTLLLRFVLFRDGSLVATRQLVVGIEAVMKMVVSVLTGGDDERQWKPQALRALKAPLLKTARLRNAVVDAGVITSLVKLAAEQEDETPFGRGLIESLRDFAAADIVFKLEIDQVAMILCSSSDDASLLSDDTQLVVHFQNLLAIYRDIPVVQFGRTAGSSKAINVLAVAEALRSECSDVERLLIVSYLHSELGLRGLDPVRCAIDAEVSSVVKAVAENLDAVVAVAVADSGSAGVKKLARSVLTLVARDDDASRAALRKHQAALDPSQPGLVVAEVLRIGLDARDGANNAREGGDDDDEEEQAYEYSDDEGDGEDEEEEDEEEVEENESDYECVLDLSTQTQAVVVATAQEDGEIQGALTGLSINDDWELV